MDDHRTYAEELGDRLRNVRQQQGLSLHEVETASGGELKASVVGAYERGERAVSVARLRTLADFYRVPVAQLLPGRTVTPVDRPRGSGLRIDLTRLSLRGEPALNVVGRYLESIQVRRGDYNGRVLTIRAADVQALAAVLDTEPGRLRADLVGAGIASEPA